MSGQVRGQRNPAGGGHGRIVGGTPRRTTLRLAIGHAARPGDWSIGRAPVSKTAAFQVRFLGPPLNASDGGATCVRATRCPSSARASPPRPRPSGGGREHSVHRGAVRAAAGDGVACVAGSFPPTHGTCFGPVDPGAAANAAAALTPSPRHPTTRISSGSISAMVAWAPRVTRWRCGSSWTPRIRPSSKQLTDAILAVRGGGTVNRYRPRDERCVVLTSYTRAWLCLFPQHGSGKEAPPADRPRAMAAADRAGTSWSSCARSDPVGWLARGQPRSCQGSRLRISALSVLESFGRVLRAVHRRARRPRRGVATVGPLSHLRRPPGIRGAAR